MAALGKNSRIVLTGGAGFIGSNLVAALNARGFERITIVDHLEHSGAWRNLVGLRYESYVDREDFLRDILSGALARPDVIIHLGACTDTTETDEAYLLSNNSLYSKALFDYCAKERVRFIYASSAATYGTGEKGFDDDEANLSPINCYGYSKHLFDQWVRTAKKKPPQSVGLKFFNVYGMNEAHKGKMASMAYHGLNQILESGTIRLFKSYRPDIADGEQVRDFVYVEDVVDVILFFLDRSRASGIFNVGTGIPRSFAALARALFTALEKKPNIEFIDMPEALIPAYQYYTKADIRQLRKAGYSTEFRTLEDGVREYVFAFMNAREQGRV